ncbi:MAG: sugar phosphate isomerase/epimerase [Ruminococcaceae bacterium]|nr:sugar phosphate isomerase/epimerase [Oscillospiraceae bacterium]
MKTAVSSYSFGSYLSEEKLGYLGIIEKAKELGFDGIEFTDAGWVCNPENALKIKEKCAEVGIVPVNIAMGANFLAENIKDTIANVREVIDIAAIIGIPFVRHDVAYGFSNDIKIGRSYDCAIPKMVDAIREVTKYAEQKGVRTCTENHGFFSQDALRVEKLINEVNHPNFGALVDIGNFMCADEDPTISVGIMAPYAIHAHAKDFHWKSGMDIDPGEGWFRTRAGNYLRGAIIGHGEAKPFQSIQTLKREGYDGFISIEYEGLEDNLYGLRVGLENLKRFIEA